MFVCMFLFNQYNNICNYLHMRVCVCVYVWCVQEVGIMNLIDPFLMLTLMTDSTV